MKAFLKNYRQSPRKTRLVTDLVKGKKVDRAVLELEHLPKRASLPIRKLILGAVANAQQMGIEKENLFVKEIRVDKGIVMKRMMPRAMGRSSAINKRTSHITLVLGEQVSSPKETKKKEKLVKIKEDEKKESKKVETKVKAKNKKNE